jgi:peptidoglycan/xylan/chitin deacetylase (PgdA/CDA1 family)
LTALLAAACLAAHAGNPTQDRRAGPAAPPPLAITHCDRAGGCVTLDLTTPEPAGRHQLEESTDLRHWQPIPIATFEKRTGGTLRTVLAGVVESACFYRVTLLEATATNPPVYVNLQVDGELEDTQGLRLMMSELQRRQITATLFVTADYANRNALLVTELFQTGFEVALHGYYTGEQLASMTYDEQKNLLSRAKLALEGCRPCGTYKPILGFRPQYFSQNEDTFRVLKELGLTYNSGFKVGQLYLAGHTWDAMPYQAPGHDFFVLPISTVPSGCTRVYLCDLACGQVEKWTPAQWRDGLLQALAEALETRQPLVVLLHGYYAGDEPKYGYWQPVLDFLDAAQGKVTFVQSKDLVDLARR